MENIIKALASKIKEVKLECVRLLDVLDVTRYVSNHSKTEEKYNEYTRLQTEYYQMESKLTYMRSALVSLMYANNCMNVNTFSPEEDVLK